MRRARWRAALAACWIAGSLLAGLLLAGSLLAACGDDTSDPGACGGACSPLAICNEATSECECPSDRTGPSCESCAAGYRPGPGDTCERVVIDCVVDPDVCGRHGTCVTTGSPEAPVYACDCEGGYAGHVCAECAPSHQDSDGNGTCLPTCATAGLSCDAPLVCTDHEGSAMCGCTAGMAGDACDRCARGYVDRGGECVPTCAAGALECAAPRTCIDSPAGASCACPTGRDGENCEECATGYVDPLGIGECRPSCAVLGPTCGDRGTCVEPSGLASCECEQGFGGTRCDECARGYSGETCAMCETGFRETARGACEPTCASEALACPLRASCREEGGVPACACDVGYAGPTCGDCAPQFTSAVEACVPSVPAGYVLMSAAVIDGRETLVAIRPSDGALFEMRNMRVGHLTVDTDNDVAFTGEWPGGAPTRIDLATGEVTDLAPGAGGTLVGHAFDTTREVIYAITTSTDLMRFPADGSAGSALATGPLPTDSRGGPIAYDAARDRILVASASGAVIAIDPETGAQTTLGSVVLPSGATALLDLAHVPATDTLYALTNAPIGGATSRIAELDPTTLAVRRSFEVAARLETPNPWSGSIATLAPWSP